MKILGLAPGATKSEIKKAFRQKAFKLHPDRNDSPDAEQAFLELIEAYEICMGRKLGAAYPSIYDENPNFNPSGKSARERANRPLNHEERQKARKEARERYEHAQVRKERMAERNYTKFKNGINYKISRYVRVLAGVLSFLLILDYFLPWQVMDAVISDQYLDLSSTGESDGNGGTLNRINSYHLSFCNRDVQVNKTFYAMVSPQDTITIRQSALFKEVNAMAVMKRGNLFSSSGGGIIHPVSGILIFSLLIWLFKGPTEQFYTMVQGMNLIGGLAILYVVLEGWRILRLFNLAGC